MNALKNNVQLVGSLASAPVVKVAENGKKFARFSVGTSEQYHARTGEAHIKTCWHSVVAWDIHADIAEKFLEKGKEVMINGQLLNHVYTDKNGVKRYITEIEVRDLFVTTRQAA
jgi:single-strand DNA-binding protein